MFSTTKKENFIAIDLFLTLTHKPLICILSECVQLLKFAGAR